MKRKILSAISVLLVFSVLSAMPASANDTVTVTGNDGTAITLNGILKETVVWITHQNYPDDNPPVEKVSLYWLPLIDDPLEQKYIVITGAVDDLQGGELFRTYTTIPAFQGGIEGVYYAFMFAGFDDRTPYAHTGDFFILRIGTDDTMVFVAFTDEKPSQTVNPTVSTVIVNGTAKAFEAYNVNGNNFFKLRDLAYALNGSAKQFSVEWDGENDAIKLTSGQPYVTVGGEMEQGDGTAKTANPTSSRVFLDGVEVKLSAYNIKGNNFFRLRDLMNALDIGVTWDEVTSTIGIDTSILYTE